MGSLYGAAVGGFNGSRFCDELALMGLLERDICILRHSWRPSVAYRPSGVLLVVTVSGKFSVCNNIHVPLGSKKVSFIWVFIFSSSTWNHLA